MKEKLVELAKDKLKEINVLIDDVFLENEGSQKFLRVVIDSEDAIDVSKVVAATKIIDPLVEELDLVEDEYILDVYGKSKGDD